MIKVENEIKIYEVDGKDSIAIDGPVLRVQSHWNERDKVVLIIDGKKLTVVARDLDAAIANAANSARY